MIYFFICSSVVVYFSPCDLSSAALHTMSCFPNPCNSKRWHFLYILFDHLLLLIYKTFLPIELYVNHILKSGDRSWSRFELHICPRSACNTVNTQRLLLDASLLRFTRTLQLRQVHSRRRVASLGRAFAEREGRREEEGIAVE